MIHVKNSGIPNRIGQQQPVAPPLAQGGQPQKVPPMPVSSPMTENAINPPKVKLLNDWISTVISPMSAEKMSDVPDTNTIERIIMTIAPRMIKPDRMVTIKAGFFLSSTV